MLLIISNINVVIPYYPKVINSDMFQTCHDLHAWGLRLGPVTANDLQINHCWPAEDVLQAGWVLLAAVQK